MGRSKPIKIVTLDTETYNGLIGDLKRIAIFDGEKVTYGYTFGDVEKELIWLSRKYEVHCYIHNIEFDARKMTGLFDPGKVMWKKSFVINNKLATIKTAKYTLHDSFKILPMGLRKLSEDFEVEHGKLDLLEEVQDLYPGEYEVYNDEGKLDDEKTLVNFLDKCHVDDPLYLKYLGYDVKSLYEVIHKIIMIAGLSLKEFVKKVSTASLSRHIFKNGYKGKEFKNPLNTTTDYEILTQYNWKNDLILEGFIRQSYAGGRTEVFKPLLQIPGFHYDINSMYPFVMAFMDYPIGRPEYYNTPAIARETYDDWCKYHNGLGFIHAHVFIPKQAIPPLPVKMGKLVFPCGHVYGVWTYNELEYAVKNCGVVIEEIFAVCHFSNTYKVFANFINEFYVMKEEATKNENESLRSFSKLVMNVGYGYTGMSRDDKAQLDDIKNIDKYDEDQILYINEEMGYIEVESEIKAEYIQVQVASYVTSYARLVLLDALRKASINGNVYYCDTDSLVTDQPLPADLIDEYRLGAWALEAKPQKALFLRPKVYAEVLEKKTNVKFKGISKETQKTLTYDSYENLYKELIENKEDSVLIEKNKTLLRSIMYMHKNNIPMDHYEVRDKKMNLKTVEKRVVNYKENYTEPLFFADLEAFKNFRFKRPKQQVGF